MYVFFFSSSRSWPPHLFFRLWCSLGYCFTFGEAPRLVWSHEPSQDADTRQSHLPQTVKCFLYVLSHFSLLLLTNVHCHFLTDNCRFFDGFGRWRHCWRAFRGSLVPRSSLQHHWTVPHRRSTRKRTTAAFLLSLRSLHSFASILSYPQASFQMESDCWELYCFAFPRLRSSHYPVGTSQAH